MSAIFIYFAFLINKLEIKYIKNFCGSKKSYFKPTECSGSYKHRCFKPKNFFGGFPQLAGDFRRTTEVTNRGIFNKLRCWVVCFKVFGGIFGCRSACFKIFLKRIFVFFIVLCEPVFLVRSSCIYLKTNIKLFNHE